MYTIFTAELLHTMKQHLVKSDSEAMTSPQGLLHTMKQHFIRGIDFECFFGTSYLYLCTWYQF